AGHTFCAASAAAKLYAMDTLEIALRLAAATLAGAALGLNRDLHGKPTGVRTLGLVFLGSALAGLSSHAATGTAASPGIQRTVTGVVCVGAGVVVRDGGNDRVLGLPTAACGWVSACRGAACAFADWQRVSLGAAPVFVIRIFGGPCEKAVDRRWPGAR